MATALRRAGPAIVASAGTVVAALLCLSLAQVNSVAGLGPVGAMGVAVAAAAMLTVLPALLLVGGRRAFWPFVPRYGAAAQDPGRGAWGRLGRAIERRHRRAWAGSAAALAVLALGMLTLDDDLTTANFFRGTVEAVEGQRLLEQSFAGASAPTVVLVREEQERERRSRLRGTRPASRPSGRSSAVTRGRASTSRSRPIPSASARSPPSSPFPRAAPSRRRPGRPRGRSDGGGGGSS